MNTTTSSYNTKSKQHCYNTNNLLLFKFTNLAKHFKYMYKSNNIANIA